MNITTATQKVAALPDNTLAKYMKILINWKNHLSISEEALEYVLEDFNQGVEPPINALLFDTLIRTRVIERFLEENQP